MLVSTSCSHILCGFPCTHTVRPMSHMHLTSLQKCNRAWWQMLFHPTALRSEFCLPLTFGQIHLSCAFCAFPGWNMTQKIHFLLHHWSIPPSPSMQYFILIGQRKEPLLPGGLFLGRMTQNRPNKNPGGLETGLILKMRPNFILI